MNKLRSQRANGFPQGDIESKYRAKVGTQDHLCKTLGLAICIPPLLLFAQYLPLNNINNSNQQ